MAGCSDGCNCVIQGGDGVIVEGAGTPSSPMVISASSVLAGALTTADTPTVNLSLSGDGTISSPMTLSAVATVSMLELTDVNDPGGPAVGDVPVWDIGGYWVFQPPPAVPAGSVNVSTGLTGTGAAITPLAVKMIGTSAGGSTAGLEVYADSAGNLRAVAPAASAVAWADITGKPSTFPPSAHTHVAADITDPLNLSVGNSVRVDGHRIYVQSTAPASGMVTNDIWLY